MITPARAVLPSRPPPQHLLPVGLSLTLSVILGGRGRVPRVGQDFDRGILCWSGKVWKAVGGLDEEGSPVADWPLSRSMCTAMAVSTCCRWALGCPRYRQWCMPCPWTNSLMVPSTDQAAALENTKITDRVKLTPGLSRLMAMPFRGGAGPFLRSRTGDEFRGLHRRKCREGHAARGIPQRVGGRHRRRVLQAVVRLRPPGRGGPCAVCGCPAG